MQRFITLLLILLPVSINAQEQELAKLAFNINLTELHRSINTDEDETIIIQTKNFFDQKGKKSKTLEICFGKHDDHEKILVNTPYPLSKYQGTPLSNESFTPFTDFKIIAHQWDISKSAISLTKNSFNDIVLSVQDLTLTPLNKYKFSIIKNSRSTNKDTKLNEFEKVITTGENALHISPSTFMENMTHIIMTKDALLGTIIATLITALFALLRVPIVNAFQLTLDFLGKYSRGKLADRRFIKRYLDDSIFNHKYLKLTGFNAAGINRPLLEEIFVSLRVSSYDLTAHDGIEQKSGLPFASVLKRNKHFVILGAPGAGKTTILSYTLLVFAQNKARIEFRINEENMLPIFIPLRRLSATNHSILEDLMSENTQILPKEILKECPKNYFEKLLKNGQCILLLDGLDEVTNEKTHRQVAEKINNMASAYPKNRMVVTCRIAGWKNLLSGFKVLETQDFSRDEIHRFVLGWQRAIITQSEHSKLKFEIPDEQRFEEKWKAHKEKVVEPGIDLQSRKLINAIDSNNRIRSIAVNPMLLSLIALVHYNRSILPKGRTILYSQCIELLVDAWDRTRDITSTIEVTADQKETILREIAFQLHHQGKSEDTRENLERLIQEINCTQNRYCDTSKSTIKRY